MARKDISMSPTEVAAFLEAGRTLLVASLHRDGRPHLVPMWYVMEDGQVVFRSFSRSQKILNLQRDPRLSALVESGEAYADLRGVMIEGRARLIQDPAHVLALYGRLAAKYAMVGATPRLLSPEELQTAFGRYAEKNTAVVVEPESVTSWDHTKLGGAY